MPVAFKRLVAACLRYHALAAVIQRLELNSIKFVREKTY